MNKKLLLILFLAFLFRVVLSFMTWHPDVNNHIDWGIRFFEYGPAKFYAPESNVWNFTWPNQPPGTMYMFAGVRKIFEFVFSIFWWFNLKIPAFPSIIISFFESNLYPALLKLPSILADIGIAVLIYKMIKIAKSEKLAILGTSIFLANPVIWYNSAVWGQTDAVINFLALLSFYFLLNKKLFWAILALALSFYIKISLTIFVPIFFVFALRQNYKIIDWVKSILFTLLVIGVATWPFSMAEPFGWLSNLYQTKVLGQQMHVITANAFNLWDAVAGIYEKPETLNLGPLTYQTWGVILFIIAYIPSLLLAYRKQDVKSVMWALAIAAFASFMLLTNMHERYLYPLFPVFTILALLETKLLPIYLLVSGVNFLNLYHLWFVPRVNFIVSFLSIGDRVVPRILGFVNFFSFVWFYKLFFQNLKLKDG